MIISKISTIDNPYDPFDEFDEWYIEDCRRGHYTCAYLARLLQTSDSMTQLEIERENNRVIDNILKNDFEGIYKKVEREVDEKKLSQI